MMFTFIGAQVQSTVSSCLLCLLHSRYLGLNDGSEHAIETTHYGGEVELVRFLSSIDMSSAFQIQFVHYNAKYRSFDEASYYKVSKIHM